MNNIPCTYMIHTCDSTYASRPPGTAVTLTHRGCSGTMWVIPLFEGILLSFNDFYMDVIPIRETRYSNQLLINYCTEGRCEVNLGDAGFVFVDTGMLSIDTHVAKSDFISPTGRYQGLELLIDFDILKAHPPVVLSALGIDMEQIRDKYCPQDKSFLAKAPETVAEIFRELEDSCNSLTRLRIGVLKLLYELLVYEKAFMVVKTGFLTKGQTEIAKHVYQLILNNMSQKHSVSAIACRLGISETSLRNYFQQVYGESIPALLRRKRLARAASELADRKGTITEIALRAGYENQSKFSAAFKRCYGETPMEYRRIQRLNRKEESLYE